MSGRVGAAPLPGSTLTASSSTSTATELQPQLQPCTSLRCPNASAADSAQLATAEELLQRLQAGAARPPLAAAPTQQPAPQPQPVQPQPAQSLLVNRAPLLGEAALAWAVEPRQAAASYLRTEDFVRLAAFELDLKAGALLAVARAGVAGAGGSGSGNSSAATGECAVSWTAGETGLAAGANRCVGADAVLVVIILATCTVLVVGKHVILIHMCVHAQGLWYPR